MHNCQMEYAYLNGCVSLIILNHTAKFSDGACMPWWACEFENLNKQQLKYYIPLIERTVMKTNQIFNIDVISTTIFTEYRYWSQFGRTGNCYNNFSAPNHDEIQ